VVAALKPTTPLMQAIDVLRRYMNQFNFGLFDGSVYKKAPESKFTFVYCSSVHDFIHHIMGNAEVADAISSFAGQIIGLLSVKACRLIRPIVINYNFIEVQPNLFIHNVFADKNKEVILGNVSLVQIKFKTYRMINSPLGSPRAFVKYTYNGKVPYPKAFIQGKRDSYCATKQTFLLVKTNY